MYAEAGLFFPYMQSFSQDMSQIEDFCKTPNSCSTMTFNISDYSLGGEGDLFKAPELIIEEPIMALDPITAALTMISCGGDIISSQGLNNVSDLGSSIHSEQQILNEAFYECEKDLLAKSAMESPLSEVLDIKIPMASVEEQLDQTLAEETKGVFPEVPFQKSISSGSLSSMEWTAMSPKFPDLHQIDFGAAYGMRRAYSEGDIQNLNHRNPNIGDSPLDRVIVNCASEYRREKLSRYRNKKTRRNFGRKIKYACRKALADSQPRIRGRFAKTEESSDFPRKQDM